MKTIISTPDAPKAIGPYSQAVRYGDLLFVSGMLGMDPKTGEMAGTDIESQAVRVLENLKAVIEAAGMGLQKRPQVDGVPERHERFCEIQRNLRPVFPGGATRPGDRPGGEAPPRCGNRDLGDLREVIACFENMKKARPVLTQGGPCHD